MQQNQSENNQANLLHKTGLAHWSIHHPIGVVMITIAVFVLGALTFGGLTVNLLPNIVRPEVRVRILDKGVPAKIMEDKITRQLEEQLAITEDAISVESTSREGRSAVDLVFEYGKNIDIVLQDASTRLDRAKRFLPTSIDPPIIYKRDPSQLPVLEYVIASEKFNSIELRSWVDNHFSKWFFNIKGVAAVEPGGGLIREIRIIPDQNRLAGQGLKIKDLIKAIREANVEEPGGRVYLGNREISSRTGVRFKTLNDIKLMPIPIKDGNTIQLHEVAKVIDSHEDEKLRVRLNDVPGVKVSIQKQPKANTVTVADLVKKKIKDLYAEKAIPSHIKIELSNDQSVFIKGSMNNARNAVIMGAILAMLVVFLFLGNIRRTLIIGSAIPIGVVVTFLLMETTNLTLNIMSVGGIAVGIGMLVDNTIVMLENIYRHQCKSGANEKSAITAAGEVNNAIIASTTTNLAAIIPFLFLSGIVGLLFKELILTISAAIIASMIVALTLVPALSTKVTVTKRGRFGTKFDKFIESIQNLYANFVSRMLRGYNIKLVIVLLLCIGLVFSFIYFSQNKKKELLPSFDTGEISIYLKTDPGVTLNTTDKIVRKIENLIKKQKDVVDVVTLSGGFIFGRTTVEKHNSGSLLVKIIPSGQRNYSTEAWIGKFMRDYSQLRLAGVKMYPHARGIRGLGFFTRGSSDISLRIQGSNLETLSKLADQVLNKVKKIQGLRRPQHSMQDVRNEMLIRPDLQRAASFGLSSKEISDAIRIAITGESVGDFLEGDYSYKIKVKLADKEIYDIQRLKSLIVGYSKKDNKPIKLLQVAKFEFPTAPYEIKRDNQQRMVEISARKIGDTSLGPIIAAIDKIKKEFRESKHCDYTKVKEGNRDVVKENCNYSLFDVGITNSLKKQSVLFVILILLAIFLVFVVLAVQYESLRNPFIIIISVPFALIGVSIGLFIANKGLSMPVYLGLIMLVGIVVNNAIVLLEYIEIARRQGSKVSDAIVKAARLRLRPILMTTLTTVAGLTPLALAWGSEGAEMLQPLAITIVSGLSFSLIISLLLIPIVYQLVHGHRDKPRQAVIS